MAGLGAGEGRLLLGIPALAERMMRGLGLQGDLPRMIRDEVQPTVSALDLTDDEFFWLRRGRRFAHEEQGGVAVGQNTVIQLAAITGPEPGAVLCKTDLLVVTNYDAANAVGIVIGLTPLPAIAVFTATKFGPMDDRQGPNTQNGAYHVGSTTTAAPPLVSGEGFRVRMPAGTSMLLPLHYILTGRQVLSVCATSVNLSIGAGFVWRERELLVQEGTR